MPDKLGFDEWRAMLRSAITLVRRNQEWLGQLDSHGGDGDHGATMTRAMGQVEKAIEAAPAGDAKQLLADVGWGIMGVDGGATGPLFGSLFRGLADEVAPDGVQDAATMAAALEAGLQAVRKLTRAQVGDKTMIDALVPAVAAARAAADRGADLSTALEAVAAAAQAGAESTKTLAARFGRAKNLGERSAGEQDPGATSLSLLFRGFAEGVK
ncbi:MAG: dihydroxyacetone kinase subunit DhaL [Verrucomicrobiota bacterium]|nr:dihydroxyacetone kinase subunit DhaL [Verrucomicrobiota bacterium]